VPQIGGMYEGDRSRKQTLVDYGFRLPSAMDNRPLRFDEFLTRVPQMVFVSATPGPYEREHSSRVQLGLSRKEHPRRASAVGGRTRDVARRDNHHAHDSERERPPAALTWLGAPLMAAAVWLFWRSHADLGDNWSVSLQLNQDHRLVTQGVYRRIRHPMYAAFFAMAIVQGLLLNNWLAGWGALAAVSLLYLLRVPHEEQMMIERFGDEYRTYRQRTGGLMPRL